MANGWDRLGESLAGLSDEKRADIQNKTMAQLAARDSAMANAWTKMDEARYRGGVEDDYAALADAAATDEDRARAIARVQRGGFNPNTGAGALGKLFEQSVRRQAQEAALAGDMGAANANLFGIASGPQELAKIQGDTVIGNRFVPGGDIRGPTEIGEARIGRLGTQMGADRALAAQRMQPRSSGGGGRAPAAQKLSEIDKMRLTTALKPLQASLLTAQADLAEVQGSTRAPPGEVMRAEQRVADLESRIGDLFAQYQPKTEGVDFVIDDPENMPPEVVAAIRQQAGTLGDELGGGMASFDNVQGTPGATAVVRSQQQYDALPSGATFVAPDGTTRRKP